MAMTLKNWFAREREKRGLRARAMAYAFGQEVGVNETTVFRWMSGDIFPGPSNIKRIRTATGGEVTEEAWYADTDDVAPSSAVLDRGAA